MKELYCITCPTGCRLTVESRDGEIEVQGNGCKRGADFAEAEIVNPMRSLTTTVRTTFPGVPVVSVRTDGEIPKGKIREAMNALSKVVIRHEVDCGDTVLEDIVGSGVRVIITSDVLQRDTEKVAQRKIQRQSQSPPHTPHIIPVDDEEEDRDKSDEDDDKGDGDGDGGGNRGPVIKPSGIGRARLRVPY